MRGHRDSAPSMAKKFVLPDFLRDDAFGLNASMTGGEISLSASSAECGERRAMLRRRYLVLGLLTLAVALFSLCLSFDGSGVGNVKLYAPWDAWGSLVTWAAWNVSQALNLGWFDSGASLSDLAPLYPQVVPRAGMTLATLVCGALLSCAGMLYQVVFRNPIASPSLLGITNGVKVGLLVMFMNYGIAAQSQIPARFAYGYTAGIITLVVVFALSKLITRRKSSISIFDMLVIGTIASAFLSALSKYILNMLASVDMWVIFFEFQEGLNIYSEPVTYAVLAVSTLVSFAPIVALRFHLNLLSFSDGEARVMGANPKVLRVLAIVAGSIMILTAQVFVGPASSFALVIPFVSRAVFGSEFRGQLWGNVLLGMLVLVVCRDLCALIPFVGIGIPIGTLAGIITLPVFIWATLFVRGAWR